MDDNKGETVFILDGPLMTYVRSSVSCQLVHRTRARAERAAVFSAISAYLKYHNVVSDRFLKTFYAYVQREQYDVAILEWNSEYPSIGVLEVPLND